MIRSIPTDLDCRFVFVRSTAQYLDPWRPRDVIETPLSEVYDVNGWDLIKAVQLAVNGNATVGEWLRSPIVYAGEPGSATSCAISSRPWPPPTRCGGTIATSG